MFAIIRTGGKQYRVRQGDEILVERLDAPEGSDVTIEDVLLVDRDGKVVSRHAPTTRPELLREEIERLLG